MLWSGRVQNELAAEVERFLAAGDAQLLPYDCRATVIHAARLQAAGLLSDDELAEAERVLEKLEYEPGEEDVHTLIERALGDVGRKIHAGRSRNDQVAAALRLYVQKACDEARDGIDALALVTLSLAEAEADTVM